MLAGHDTSKKKFNYMIVFYLLLHLFINAKILNMKLAANSLTTILYLLAVHKVLI
jgi:hypothetical protein